MGSLPDWQPLSNMPPVWDLRYWLAGWWMFWLPGVVPVRKAQPWPRIKLKMKGWEGCDGRERPGFVSLDGEVMRRTKVVSGKPAGTQLTRTKRSARVGLHPDAALFQRGSRSKLCFPFRLHHSFYVWVSGRHVSLSKSGRLTHLHFALNLLCRWIIRGSGLGSWSKSTYGHGLVLGHNAGCAKRHVWPDV